MGSYICEAYKCTTSRNKAVRKENKNKAPGLLELPLYLKHWLWVPWWSSTYAKAQCIFWAMLGFLIGELTTHKSPRAPSSEISGVGLRGLLALDLNSPFQMTFGHPKNRSWIFSISLYLQTISRSQKRWYACQVFLVVEML